MSDRGVNDFVVRFANVNGTGSASANGLFAKAIFRMGIPIAPKNIFPSNIQGLPTWYEVRISEKGFLGRRAGVDILVGVNPQSFEQDLKSVVPGGYFIYDSSKPMYDDHLRDDVQMIGIPMMELSMTHYKVARLQQLFKNIIYLGSLAALIDIDLDVIKSLIEEQFKAKPKLVPPNHQALELGYNYAKDHLNCPLDLRLEARDKIGDKILIDGNTAIALGTIYGGATVLTWYPITPSTSVAKAFQTYAKKLRIDSETGKNKFAIVQAEDELSAIGMVLGASWNGARSFTATSGAGISLMNEFIGLAYYAEIPATLINVQRGGPSTGMPTRTQQADLLACAYASHGDTKHVLLFPSNPKECFEFGALALDLADRLQTPIFVMTDLDLGMNEHISEPLEWDEERKYDRGKVLNAQDLEDIEAANKEWGRYLDIDGDGICYRTIPGTHETLGSYFTRGSSHNEFARYSESSEDYVRLVDRLSKKFETAKNIVPKPEFYNDSNKHSIGIIFFGTTTYSALEAMSHFEKEDIKVDAMRIRAFPFSDEVKEFINNHDSNFVIEQNKDGQMRTLLINELEVSPERLISILNYDGMPITAQQISEQIAEQLAIKNLVSEVL